MPHKLRQALSNLAPVTVQYMGWAGLKNGELLDEAESAGFDVVVTGDKTVEYEQNMDHRNIAVVSLSAPHWPIIKEHIDEIALAIARANPGSFARVDCGRFTRHR